MQRKTNKIIMLLTVLMLMTVCFAFGASAYGPEESGQCGENVFWTYDSETGVVVISGEGPTYDYPDDNSPFRYNGDVINNTIIEEGITYLGDHIFACSDSKLEIPASVTEIHKEALWLYQGEFITVDENNQYYSNDEYGVLFNKDKTKLIQYPRGSERTTYTVPDGVKIIGELSFADGGSGALCSLEEIILPESLETIGMGAFMFCVALEKIEFPENLKSIGLGAFYLCIKLKDVTIPENTVLDFSVFEQCIGLENIYVLGENDLSNTPFSNCSSANIYVMGKNNKIPEQSIGYSSIDIAGMSRAELVDLQAKYWLAFFREDDYEKADEILAEMEDLGCEFINYDTPQPVGKIYCHTGSTAETYAIENGVTYELIHFFDDSEWFYDYNNMVRTRKCTFEGCEEIESEPLESTNSGDVEIIEPVDPDTDFEVDEIEKNNDKYILVEDAFNNHHDSHWNIVKIFDITMKNKDGVHVQPDGTVKVKLPHDWKHEQYKVYRVNDDGTLTDMNAYREGSHIVFETDHFSLYVIVDESEPAPEETCTCLCHSDGSLLGTIIAWVYKLVMRMIGIDPVCKCGVAHY